MASIYVPKATIHTAVSVFDPGTNPGIRASGASYTLPGDAIPYGAVVLGYWVKNEQTFTSAGDTATIALSLTGYTGTVRTAIAINNGTNPWDAGTTLGTQSCASALTAPAVGGSHVVATVAVQDLTAGRAVIGIIYALIG